MPSLIVGYRPTNTSDFDSEYDLNGEFVVVEFDDNNENKDKDHILREKSRAIKKL